MIVGRLTGTAALIISLAAASALRGNASSPYSESDMLIAPAIITSMSGTIEHLEPDGKTSLLKPHDIIFTDDSSLTTLEDSHGFLVFSNGISLGIDSLSTIEVERYKQLPFAKNKESQRFEPSVSELKIRLNKGSLALVSDHLSPLSKFIIELPIGELRVHSASAYINYDETGVRVTAYSGSLTFYYPGGKGREFIAVPTSMRVSKESVALGRYAEKITVEEAPEAWNIFTSATENAGKRVFYRSGGNKATPVPVLIIPHGYFEQPESRPYQLIE
ncbi:MAG: hypothetical protein AAGH40_06630 [Verrucomicrobiota bacterium]